MSKYLNGFLIELESTDTPVHFQPRFSTDDDSFGLFHHTDHGDIEEVCRFTCGSCLIFGAWANNLELHMVSKFHEHRVSNLSLDLSLIGGKKLSVDFPNQEYSMRMWDSEYLYAEYLFFKEIGELYVKQLTEVKPDANEKRHTVD